MPRKTRSYSAYTIEASHLLGKLVRYGRITRKMTAQDLASRAGISRGLLLRIEKGDPKCELGTAFEVAALVGVRLFDSDEHRLGERKELLESKLAVLPKAIQKKRKAVDDDF